MKINRYIHGILENYKNFKDYWNYEDGCVLSGCMQLFEVTGERIYRDFIFRYLESLIADDGAILNFDNSKYSVDSFNSGKVLFFALSQSGEEKYRRAIEYLWTRLESYPRTSEGNFIHKSIYPDQVWLDGLYMVQPFYALYEKYFGSADYDDITKQFINVRKRMFIAEKSLYCHGYDTARVQFWADRNSGLSGSFWLRSAGWYMMALADVIDIIGDTENKCSRELAEIFKEAVNGILKYEDGKTGLFYQVIDRGDDTRNYMETSGSLMIAYSLIKGSELGMLEKDVCCKKGMRIFEYIVREKLTEKNNQLSLTDICSSAGLGPGDERDGSPEYYFSEKIVSDDPKGIGALMMVYAHYIKCCGKMQEEEK